MGPKVEEPITRTLSDTTSDETEEGTETGDNIQTEDKIVVGIPTYNEEIAIGSVVLQADQYADEVIVIDDGGSDATVSIARDNIEVENPSLQRCCNISIESPVATLAGRESLGDDHRESGKEFSNTAEKRAFEGPDCIDAVNKRTQTRPINAL